MLKVQPFAVQTMELLDYELVPVGTTTITRTWLGLDSVSCTVEIHTDEWRNKYGYKWLSGPLEYAEPIEPWVYGMVVSYKGEILSGSINTGVAGVSDVASTIIGKDTPTLLEYRFTGDYSANGVNQATILTDLVSKAMEPQDNNISVIDGVGEVGPQRERTYRSDQPVTAWTAIESLMHTNGGIGWRTSHKIEDDELHTSIDYRHASAPVIGLVVGQDCAIESQPESADAPITRFTAYGSGQADTRLSAVAEQEFAKGGFTESSGVFDLVTTGSLQETADGFIAARDSSIGRFQVRMYGSKLDFYPGDHIRLSGRYGPWIWDNSLMGISKVQINIEASRDPYCVLDLVPLNRMGQGNA